MLPINLIAPLNPKSSGVIVTSEAPLYVLEPTFNECATKEATDAKVAVEALPSTSPFKLPVIWFKNLAFPFTKALPTIISSKVVVLLNVLLPDIVWLVSVVTKLGIPVIAFQATDCAVLATFANSTGFALVPIYSFQLSL